MTLVCTMAGEAKIVSPAGTIHITSTIDGQVIFQGSVSRFKTAWYLDQLKAAREYIRTGRRPVGFRVGGTEPTANKAWYLKMFTAVEDALRRVVPDIDKFRPVKGTVPLGRHYQMTFPRGK